MASFMSGSSCFLAFCVWYTAVETASGNAFLSKDLPHLNLNSNDLLSELEKVLGSVHRDGAEQRAGELEEKMRPTFVALPRDMTGRLDPAAVRYLLHRYFVDRHGWYVLGFDTEGEAWNSSSPTGALEGHLGPATSDVFEDRLGSRGLSLHEVSLLAATLESFVHTETIERLHAAYRVLGMSRSDEDHAIESEVLSALDTYMLMYVLGMNHSVVTRYEIQMQMKDINEIYPTWHETTKWMREVRKEVLSKTPSLRNSFSTTVQVMEEIGDRYGRWQDKECMELKETMLKLEQPGTGRVPLSTFYQAALNGQWQFSEHDQYLRQLGSLDESNPQKPSVVIANYINSPANCVAASKFYSVCCINECESLLSYIEQQVASPTASPKQIIHIVENLPSSTVDAPRKLSEQKVERLNEIASQHGGQVPFHARLFNQWLHHAYPRECPYPHLSGTSKPVAPEKWMAATGMSVEADPDTMRWHVEQGNADNYGEFGEDEELPWSSEEEFFISHSVPLQEQNTSVASFFRGAAFIAIAVSMSIALVRMFATVQQSVGVHPKSKIMV